MTKHFGFFVLSAALASAIGAAVVTAQQPARSTNDGVFTEEQAKRGKAIYEQRCSVCHGDGLGGVEMAPPLTGPEFDGNWVKTPLSDLFERIRVTMPADDPGSLGQAKSADVVAYILSVNKYKAGPNELPAGADLLQTITIGGQ